MLITTIVMMLVLAVALTTSSLAWFSASQQTVTANGGTFTARAVDSTNVNIALADALDGTWSNSIALASYNPTMDPACPTAEISTSADLTSLTFHSARIQDGKFQVDANNKLGNQTVTFSKNEVAQAQTEGADFTSAQVYTNSIYVISYDDINKLGSLDVSLKAKLEKDAVPVVYVRMTKLNYSGGTLESETYLDSELGMLHASKRQYTHGEISNGQLVATLAGQTSETSVNCTAGADEDAEKLILTFPLSCGDAGIEKDGIVTIDIVI